MPRRTDISSVLIIGAGLFGLAPASLATPPSDIPNIEVLAPDTGAPMLWLGFFAFGDQAAIDRLAAAAQAEGLRGGRVETDGDEKEYGVLFSGRTTREHATAFGRRVMDGEFGHLRIESMLVPPSAVRRPGQ